MTKRERKSSTADPNQSARFIEAARELGCDESPGAFEAAVKKVARHKKNETVADPKDGKKITYEEF